MADYTKFYEYFHTSFLTTANSLPINSMWLVTITKIPENITDIIDKKENWKSLNNSSIASSKTMMAHNNKKGLILAQGVKVVGDSMDVTREGIKNTGMIQGIVGNGRTGFPTLNISFMENNISFTDFVLRPWTVAVSHNSLKDHSLKSDIDIILLSKTGLGKDLATRKAISYKNCTPVNIDDMEHNYSGADMLKLRTVQFAFTHYEMKGSDDVLLQLLGETIDDINIAHEAARSPSKTPKSAGKAGTKPTVTSGRPYVDPSYSTSDNDLDLVHASASSGNNTPKVAGTSGSSPNVSPDRPYVEAVKNTPTSFLEKYIENVTEKAKEFGKDLVRGTLQNVFTNTVGAIEDTVINAVNEVKGDIRGIARNGINAIDDAVNNALGNVDTIKPSGQTLLNSFPKEDDTPIFKTPTQDNVKGKKTIINTNADTNTNDAIDSNTPIKYIIRNTNQNDHVFNMFSTPDDKKTNQNDYIQNVTPVQDDKKTNTNDFIKNVQTTKNDKTVSQNDHITGKLNQTDIPINQNDNIQGTIPYNVISTKTNDSIVR